MYRRSRKSQSRCRATPPPTAAVIAEANPVGRNSLERAHQKTLARALRLFGCTAGAKMTGSSTGPSERDRQSEYVRSAICTGWSGTSAIVSMTVANVVFHDGDGDDEGKDVISYTLLPERASKYKILHVITGPEMKRIHEYISTPSPVL